MCTGAFCFLYFWQYITKNERNVIHIDAGRVVWQLNISVGYLDQYAEIEKNMTMRSFLKSAFSRLYQLEREMAMAYEKAAMGNMEYLSLAARHQEQLEIYDFYSIDTQIEQVANGLGLLAIGLDRPIDKMSGGQRAKVILAKLLLEKPDVLLLDEPTNFLDKEHITWLSDYLSGLDNAFMVVPHDYAFLEKIANRIRDIGNDNITKYYGTYAEFLRKKTLLREDYVRQYSVNRRRLRRQRNSFVKTLLEENLKWPEDEENNLSEWRRWRFIAKSTLDKTG
jgi:ATPase subunit of ABC transporter with duplicated ATPase domains